MTDHQHEAWMVEESAKGGLYCKACGMAVVINPDDPSQAVTAPLTVPPVPRAEVVTMSIVSGGTIQQVIDVLRVDHRRGRVLIRCSPDTTPRWVALAKPRTGTCPECRRAGDHKLDCGRRSS